MSHRVGMLLVWCCMLLAPRVGAQAPPPTPLPVTPQPQQLTVADGLPSNEIMDIDEDADGYLWVATSDGLARFDGLGWRIWRLGNGLRDNMVWAVRVDTRNRVWIATERAGFAVLDTDRTTFHYYDHASVPAVVDSGFWAIATMPDGDVWVGSVNTGLYRVRANGRVEHYPAAPDDPHGLPAPGIVQLRRGPDDRLWICTHHSGVAVWDGATFERLPLVDGHAFTCDGLTIDDTGMLWIATSEGVRGWDGHGYVTPPWPQRAGVPRVFHVLLQDRSGARWLDTSEGLGRDDSGQVRNVPLYSNAAHGLVKPQWSGAFEDREGGLWFAGSSNGLWYLRRDWRQFSVFARTDDPASIGNASVFAIAPARDGRLWMAGSGGTIDLFDPRDGTLQHKLSNPCDGYLPLSLLQDSAGTVWIGCKRGLVRYDPDTGRSSGTGMDDGAPANLRSIKRIVETPQRRLWLYTEEGLRITDLDGNTLDNVAFGADRGLAADERIHDVRVGPDGHVWVATTHGLLAWNDAEHQLRPVPGAPNGDIQALAIVDAFHVWIATLGTLQLYQWDGTTLRPGMEVGAEQGVPRVDANGLVADRAGAVWMTTARGLVRIDTVRRSARVYGIGDGLPSQEFGYQPVLAAAGRRMLAGTPEGLVVFDPDNVRPAQDTPTLVVDSLSVRHGDSVRTLDPKHAFTLAHDDRDLTIVARIPSFTDAAAHRYRLRLLGYETAWTDVDADGRRVFSQLQPGSYRLQVMGKTADNLWSRIVAVPFRVDPPWWRTGWALAAYILTGLLLATWWAYAYRKRLKRRHSWQLAVQKRELAEQASEAKTRFLATLGHEVRTPMTGVLGMSELLAATTLEPKQRGYVDAIRRAGEHLLRLVNDALDLARIEAGKLQLDEAIFDPRGLIDEVSGLMAPIAEARGLHFRDSIAAGVPRALRGDRTRVQQILLNLLGNAIKFTERGFIAVELSPLLPQGVRFVVKDSGPGLNEEQKQRVFERFEQAEGARTAARYGGSGLGLAISQELAAAMGGRIRVESRLGEGTDFIVELPLQSAGAAKPATARAPQVPPRARRLLLVEDDPTVAEVVAGLLRGQGHDVVHVGNGLAALVEIAHTPFDGALLDLDLPGIDGLSLARQLRAQRFAQPLIAVSARTDADVEQQARDAGFDRFLRKPLTGEMLADALEHTAGPAAPREPAADPA